MSLSFINECLPHLENDLIQEISKNSVVKPYAAKDYIVKQGQYIKFLPVVLKGHVKVFSFEESVQFLLYYIKPGDPCIFSFAHVLNEQKIEFSAIAESPSELLLLPMNAVNLWLQKYTSFSQMLLSAYQKHYHDLLTTTKQITCHNLEPRLINYLNTKASIKQSNLLAITHQEIADDLGTSREVISRLMKKLSQEKQVEQMGRKIKVF